MSARSACTYSLLGMAARPWEQGKPQNKVAGTRNQYELCSCFAYVAYMHARMQTLSDTLTHTDTEKIQLHPVLSCGHSPWRWPA